MTADKAVWYVTSPRSFGSLGYAPLSVRSGTAVLVDGWAKAATYRHYSSERNVGLQRGVICGTDSRWETCAAVTLPHGHDVRSTLLSGEAAVHPPVTTQSATYSKVGPAVSGPFPTGISMSVFALALRPYIAPMAGVSICGRPLNA